MTCCSFQNRAGIAQNLGSQIHQNKFLACLIKGEKNKVTQCGMAIKFLSQVIRRKMCNQPWGSCSKDLNMYWLNGHYEIHDGMNYVEIKTFLDTVITCKKLVHLRREKHKNTGLINYDTNTWNILFDSWKKGILNILNLGFRR